MNHKRRFKLLRVPQGYTFERMFAGMERNLLLSIWASMGSVSLRWRHDEPNGVSNPQPRDCLLKCLFRCRSKKTSKLRVTGLCAENSPGTGEFSEQKARKMFPFDDVIMFWRLAVGLWTINDQQLPNAHLTILRDGNTRVNWGRDVRVFKLKLICDPTNVLSFSQWYKNGSSYKIPCYDQEYHPLYIYIYMHV